MRRYFWAGVWSFLLLVSLAGVGTQVRDYHVRLLHHRREAMRASVYLKTQVCMDARTKANLGDFHNCDAASKILEISPWISAWYDLVEDWHVCGHGRCQLLLEDLTYRVQWWFWLLVAALAGMMFMQYRQTAQIQQLARFNLPVGMPYQQIMR